METTTILSYIYYIKNSICDHQLSKVDVCLSISLSKQLMNDVGENKILDPTHLIRKKSMRVLMFTIIIPNRGRNQLAY